MRATTKRKRGHTPQTRSSTSSSPSSPCCCEPRAVLCVCEGRGGEGQGASLLNLDDYGTHYSSLLSVPSSAHTSPDHSCGLSTLSKGWGLLWWGPWQEIRVNASGWEAMELALRRVASPSITSE